MDQQEHKRPTLQSSEELKGEKAASPKSMNKLLVLLAVIVVAGALAGLYFGTDLFAPEETTEVEVTATTAPDTRVPLLEGSSDDFAKATVTIRDTGATYTVIRNEEEEEVETTEETAETTEEVAETTEEAAETTEEVAETTEEVAETTEEAAVETTEEAVVTEEETAVEEDDGTIIHETVADQTYSLEGKPYFLMNSSYTSSIANFTTLLTAQNTIAENSDNLAEFGLEDPAVVVDVTYVDGTTHQLRFGDLTPTENYYYCQIDEDPAVYVVYTSVYKAFNKTETELHASTSAVTVSADYANHILIEQEGKDTIEVGYENSDEATFTINSLKLFQPIYYNANSERVQTMFEGEAAIALSGYTAHVSTDEELAEYGLNPAKTHIYASGEETDDDGNAVTVEFEIWLGSTQGDYTYARIDDTGDIYLVKTSLLTFLDNARVMYLYDQFAGLVTITKVDQLTITTKDTSYPLRIDRTTYTDDEGEEQTQELYYFDDTLTTEDLFKDFYQILIGRLCDKECPEDGYDGEVALSITYNFNEEDLEDFTVEYLDYDEDYYALRRDGHTYFLIRRTTIQELLDACEQYRNGEFVGDEG